MLLYVMLTLPDLPKPSFDIKIMSKHVIFLSFSTYISTIVKHEMQWETNCFARSLLRIAFESVDECFRLFLSQPPFVEDRLIKLIKGLGFVLKTSAEMSWL